MASLSLSSRRRRQSRSTSDDDDDDDDDTCSPSSSSKTNKSIITWYKIITRILWIVFFLWVTLYRCGRPLLCSSSNIGGSSSTGGGSTTHHENKNEGSFCSINDDNITTTTTAAAAAAATTFQQQQQISTSSNPSSLSQLLEFHTLVLTNIQQVLKENVCDNYYYGLYESYYYRLGGGENVVVNVNDGDPPSLLQISIDGLHYIKIHVSGRLWTYIDGDDIINKFYNKYLNNTQSQQQQQQQQQRRQDEGEDDQRQNSFASYHPKLPRKSYAYKYIIPIWHRFILIVEDILAIIMVLGVVRIRTLLNLQPMPSSSSSSSSSSIVRKDKHEEENNMNGTQGLKSSSLSRDNTYTREIPIPGTSQSSTQHGIRSITSSDDANTTTTTINTTSSSRSRAMIFPPISSTANELVLNAIHPTPYNILSKTTRHLLLSKRNNDDNINNDSSSSNSNSSKGKSILVYSTSIIGLVSCAMSMIIHTDNVFVMIASILSILFSIMLPVQHYKIGKIGTLRQQQNVLRHKVNAIVEERVKLQTSINELFQYQLQLQDVPNQLQHVIDTSNTDINRLLHILEEQKSIQNNMKERMKQHILQFMMTILLTSDRDSNFNLTYIEIDILIRRLHVAMKNEFDDNVDHSSTIVIFHEERFRELIGRNPSISNIMTIIKRSLYLHDDEGGEEGNGEHHKVEVDRSGHQDQSQLPIFEFKSNINNQENIRHQYRRTN